MNAPTIFRGQGHWLLFTALAVGVAGYFGGRWSVAISYSNQSVQQTVSRNSRTTALQTSRYDVDPIVPMGPICAAPGYKQRQWKDYAAELERMAKAQPAQALQRALAERNLSLRAKLLCAVLRGWASTDPSAAAEWALRQPETDRGRFVEAVMAGGASVQPAMVAQIATQLSERDPVRATEYSDALINALGEVGAFDVAVRFVVGTPTSPQQLETMNKVFSLWGEHDPNRASGFLNEITDTALREEAYRGLSIGWAQADPAALAQFAVGLPPGERRAQAFANALPRWLEVDPAAATSWIQEYGTDPHPDFDSAVLAVTASAAVTARRPDLAVSLAESIADPLLRTNALRTLALKWAESDAAAARRYVDGSRMFTTEERASLITEVSAGAK